MKLGYAAAAEVVRSNYNTMLGELMDVEYIPVLLVDDRDDVQGQFTVRIVETQDQDLYNVQYGFMDSLFRAEIVTAPAEHAELIGQFALVDGPSIELVDVARNEGGVKNAGI